jgi:hypothetical protein
MLPSHKIKASFVTLPSPLFKTYMHRSWIMVEYGVKIEVLLGMYEGASGEFDGNTVWTHWEQKQNRESPLQKPRTKKLNLTSLLIGCMTFPFAKKICIHFQPGLIPPFIDWGYLLSPSPNLAKSCYGWSPLQLHHKIAKKKPWSTPHMEGKVQDSQAV